MSELLRPDDAKLYYDLQYRERATRSAFENALRSQGIASIEMPLSSNDFDSLSKGFGVCIQECPELLAQTYGKLDHRYGNEVGYVRKDVKRNEQGLQIQDGKHYIHFSESVHSNWQERFREGPKILRDFLDEGFEIHNTLIQVAKRQIHELEESYPNISQLYFPHDDSLSFLRLLRYDGYSVDEASGEVAKPHYDIGGLTIQAYADAKGFWGTNDRINGTKTHYDTTEHQAYAFWGKGHGKVYGQASAMQPLWHGVDRIIPAGLTWAPERTAVILFVDAPTVDYAINSADTLPHLSHKNSENVTV